MKKYWDASCSVRTPSFRVEDKVRVRKPVHVLKGHQKFFAPITIKKQVGPCTYILDDGKTWHASHLQYPLSLVEAQFRQKLNGKKMSSQ